MCETIRQSTEIRDRHPLAPAWMRCARVPRAPLGVVPGVSETAADPGLAAVRFRARCVRVAREAGIPEALALGVSRASLHRWRERHEAGGLEALVDRSRGPQPSRLPTWVEQAVIVVRLLTYWNSNRLAAEFTRREIYPLGHHAVDGLLADLGTARPSVRRERGPAYERGPRTGLRRLSWRVRAAESPREWSSPRPARSVSTAVGTERTAGPRRSPRARSRRRR